MNQLRIASKILTIVLIVMLLSTILLVQAGGEGRYTFLNFPGAEPGHCTGWYVSGDPYDASKWPAFWSPGVVQYTITDGTGRIISQGAQNIMDNFGGAQRITLQSYGMSTADWAGAKNPIRAVVTVDGDLIADLTADNPCLTGASSSSRPASSGSAVGSSGNTNTYVAPTIPADACSLHTSSNRLNVRSGAGTSFAVVGTLTLQAEYPILKQAKDGSGTTWLQIDLPEVDSAWVISTYVTVSTDCPGAESTLEAPLAITTEEAPSPDATEESPAVSACTITTKSNGLRQRSGPGTNFSIVGLMENGIEYPVLGVSKDSRDVDWWQIDAGDVGPVWVISSSTTAHGDCTRAPLVSVPLNE